MESLLEDFRKESSSLTLSARLNPDIRHFIASNGLDKDLLDDRDEALEDWRLKWEGLAKGFMGYLQDRFASIEQRLDRLE
jgi:hypothetical protein